MIQEGAREKAVAREQHAGDDPERAGICDLVGMRNMGLAVLWMWEVTSVCLCIFLACAPLAGRLSPLPPWTLCGQQMKAETLLGNTQDERSEITDLPLSSLPILALTLPQMIFL